jgi:acylaminoacyl-peptidase
VLSVQAKFSISDQDRDEKRSITQNFTVTGLETDSPLVIPGVVQDTTDVVLSKISRSGTLQAILREAKEKRFVEIWKVGGATPIASLNVTDTHEGFFADGIVYYLMKSYIFAKSLTIDVYASLSFSPSENILLYVAEAKRPPAKEDAWAHFRYRPTLGEGYKGKREPATFIFKWGGEGPPTSERLKLPSNNGPDYLLGHVQFSSTEENTIYAAAFEYMSDGRLLGLRACPNRPSKVYQLQLSGTEVEKMTVLSSYEHSARSPKALPDGGAIWLGHKTGGAHAGTSTLHRGGGGKEAETIVDVVQEPSEKGGFPGLYPGWSLPSQPFVAGGKGIVVSSLWGSRITALHISLADGSVKDLLPEKAQETWNVLGTDGEKRLLCSTSTPTSPAKLVLLELDDAGKVAKTVVLSEPSLPEECMSSLLCLWIFGLRC